LFSTLVIIAAYDVFHFHYGTTLTFNHFDLVALNDLGKKVFMNYWGRDVRLKSKALPMNPYLKMESGDDDQTIQKLLGISRYVRHCIVCDEEVCEYVKEYFEFVHIIRAMIDLEKVKPVYNSAKRAVFTIIHAPSSQELKGSESIIRAIDDLKKDYAINFRVIEGIPHEKAMKLYEEADLIVDQVLAGSYGKLAIEAMALGKPVICHISDFMREKYPASLPILSASPDTIGQTIEHTLKNRDMLPELGRKGRAYVEQYHDMNRETARLVELYLVKQ
jgi:glycosyltransferase involved in cell wall biosynthesis